MTDPPHVDEPAGRVRDVATGLISELGMPFHRAYSRARRAQADGDPEAAEEMFREALAALDGQAGYVATNNIVAILFALRQFEAARAVVDEYLANADDESWLPPGLSDALKGMSAPVRDRLLRPVAHIPHQQAAAMLELVGEYAEAAERLQRAEQVAGVDWWRTDTDPWQVRVLMARIEARRPNGSARLAEAWFDEAMTLFEDARIAGVDDLERTAAAGLAHGNRIYAHAAVHAVTRGTRSLQDRAVRAFDLLERGRARALLDLIAANVTLREKPPEVAEAVREWRTRRYERAGLRHLPSTDAHVVAAERNVAAAERRLHEHWPDFLTSSSPAVQALDAGRVQELLPDGVVLITYAACDDQLLVLAVRGGPTPAAQASCPVIGWDVLPVLLAQWTKANRIEGGDPVQLHETGRELARLLLSPFDELLATARGIIFVPEGSGLQAPLHTLPFRGRPLIDTLEVTYLPAAGLLEHVRGQSPSGRGRALIVGDPAGMRRPDGSSPGPLPCAAVEAQIVARYCDDTALIGSNATVREVTDRVPDARILHLATHSVIDARDPARSVLLLADAATLTVEDFLRRGFSADLVVLSACDSGVGRQTAGGEVLGLARVLLAAGARTVIVTLWRAFDLTAQRLMHDFYRLLPDHGPARALALAQRRIRHLRNHEQLREQRQAKDWLAGQPSGDLSVYRPVPHNERDTRHPRYWAPFIVIGGTDRPGVPA